MSRRQDGWKSDAPTYEARARHRAWVALNYPCTYAEYLAAKNPIGNIQATPENGKPDGWKSDGPSYPDRIRHREWCRVNRRWIPFAEYESQRKRTTPKTHPTTRDRGLLGSPQAIIYKINKMAMGLA